MHQKQEQEQSKEDAEGGAGGSEAWYKITAR